MELKEFKSGDHPLFAKELLEHACDEGTADTEEFPLTGKARDLFLADIDLKEKKQNRGGNFIAADGIAEKTLSYSGRIKARVAEERISALGKVPRPPRRFPPPSPRQPPAVSGPGTPAAGLSAGAPPLARK
jgi:hypothetical protein